MISKTETDSRRGWMILPPQRSLREGLNLDSSHSWACESNRVTIECLVDHM